MSDKFNFHVMRSLFNPQRSIQRPMGERRRIPFKTSLSEVAQTALRSTVPTGKGKSGSATIELALRFLLALVGSLDLGEESEAMALAIVDHKQLVRNLRRAADYIEFRIPER